MIHNAWFGLVAADESKTGCEPGIRKEFFHVWFYAYSVLYHQYEGARVQQWCQQLPEQMIVCGLECHYHHIHLRHLFHIIIYIGCIKMEISIAWVDLYSMLAHIIIIAVQQEMHIKTSIGQFAAIIASYGTRSDNCILHIFFVFCFVDIWYMIPLIGL